MAAPNGFYNLQCLFIVADIPALKPKLPPRRQTLNNGSRIRALRDDNTPFSLVLPSLLSRVQIAEHMSLDLLVAQAHRHWSARSSGLRPEHCLAGDCKAICREGKRLHTRTGLFVFSALSCKQLLFGPREGCPVAPDAGHHDGQLSSIHFARLAAWPMP